MSKISEILDALKARVVATLPTHKQLTNPYNVSSNTEKALNLGFGIAAGPGDNTNRNLSCKLSINRTIIIILTEKFYATDLNIVAKETVEKNLFEAQFLVIKAIEEEPSLTGLTIKSEYVSDGGIARVKEDRDQFLKIESVFNFEYTESLI